MRAVAPVLLLIITALAGCVAEGASPPIPTATGPEPVPAPALAGEIDRDGPGWVFLYRAQDRPTEGYSYRASIQLQTEATTGPHSFAFFGPVAVALLGDGSLALQLDFFTDKIERSPSGEGMHLGMASSGGGSPARNPIAGFAIIAAADTAFHLEYELTLTEGTQLNASASFDATGNGTAFHYAGGLPGHLATFKSFSVDLEESGWSHFQILTGLGNSGPSARATHVAFPSERRESHVEAYVPMHGSPPVGYAGVIRDTPGQFYAQSLIVEPHLDVELVLLHMPGVADRLGYGWRDGSYFDGSPPVLSADRWHTTVPLDD